MQKNRYDFVVIGGGVVGAAIARTLAGTNHTVAVIDKNKDVCNGTSKANTAILHTGYDAKPGTLEAALVARGYHLTWEYCQQTGVSVERTGAILVAWDEEQANSLPDLQKKALDNGYTKTELISADEVYQQLPSLGPGATGGLTVPDESVIDAWSVPLALATDAVARGADLLLDRLVTGITVNADYTIIKTTKEDVETKWTINATGLGGDQIDRMFGYDRLEIYPRRGELLVYDKLAAPLASKIVLAAPSKVGKGVLISPTIYGNIMLGPTADEIEDRTDTGTSEAGFDFLLEKGQKIMPSLVAQEVTAAYAGVRAAHNQTDYLIDADKPQRYLIAGAIRSTGLTSAMAVAEYVQNMLAEMGIDMTAREILPDPPAMPPLGQSSVRPYQNAAMIETNPDYGQIICFCERVTKGEIMDALNSLVPPNTLEGMRRRTRAVNGRCQGFFCGAKVKNIFDEFQATKVLESGEKR